MATKSDGGVQQKARTDWGSFNGQSTQFGKKACKTDMASTKKRPYETVSCHADVEELLKHKVLRWSRSLSNVFKGCSKKKGAKYLEAVSRKITECRGQKHELKNPAGAMLSIGPVEDTKYDDSPDVNGWGKFYLPETVEMKVIGYVTGTPFPCDQFVLMTCEDQQVFGYDGETLYLVASSLNKLCCEGLAYPELKSYYYGEAFKHMTEDDWKKVKQGPVGKRLEEEHRKLLASFNYISLKHVASGGMDQGLDCIKPSGVHLSAAIPYTQCA